VSEPTGAQTPGTEEGVGERAIDALLAQARYAAPHELPELVTEQAVRLGALDATIYLVDLQQVSLTPFIGQGGPGAAPHPTLLPVDSTVAGRVHQHGETIVQPGPETGATVWLPLHDGATRLGVLSVHVADPDDVATPQDRLWVWLGRFASLVGQLVALRARYGDSIVVATRSAEVGLAAEIQWGLLPPLTFASAQVSVAGILEPAYDVAGDSVDYAVDPGVACIAIFDGMGHGLRSAQLAALSVAAYRNARRGGRSLPAPAAAIDEAVEAGSGGESYTTAVLAELDTGTGQLSWVNAGHPDPLLLRQGQLVRSLHVDPGLPFGLGLRDTDHAYAVGSEQLEPGDQVLFHTDGVTEARSPSGDLFGVDRLVDLLARTVAENLSPAESMRRVGRELLAHQEAHLTDDATLMLLLWPGQAVGDEGSG
jgi:hypothetical protein